jgi:hypothetical protein
MAITPIDSFPERNSASFKPRVETFFSTEFPTAIDEINTAILAFNANDLRGTSTTTYTPNVTGNQAFTTQSGKSWVPGMWVTGGYTSGGNEYWAGVVVSYSSTTLTVNVKVNGGTATPRSAWSISFSPPVTDLIGDAELLVNTGNGYGSTNTKRRRYTTIYKNTIGASVTYADSATLGATFTVNAAGDYVITRQERNGGANAICGIALNASSGTTNFNALAYAQKLTGFIASTNAALFTGATIIRTLAPGDVITAHDDSVLSTSTVDDTSFFIKRLR